MTVTAIVLLALGVVLAEPVSRTLAAARWPSRDPVGGLLLWQAVGLAGGLALLGAGATYGLSPLGATLPLALGVLLGQPSTVLTLPVVNVVALGLTALVAARLLGVLGLAVIRTLMARRKHRELLDILATPWPAMVGARVLAHPRPMAYCLPGHRSRLVLSEGILATLTPTELAAVLAHERTHLRERHDLVVLPFVAWGATAPWVPGMVRAQAAVAALIEMRADDVAASRAGRDALAAALRRLDGVMDSRGGADHTVGSFSSALTYRLGRVIRDDNPPGRLRRIAARLAAVALIAVPTLVLLHP
ncbi:MAG TPA: M56 family metallopeptidase [Pseudonocardia sp.]|jgi:Zn-dependent protease with chaperone function|nr:M56 family metallopeptidase [Pseudonocardia sp.]